MYAAHVPSSVSDDFVGSFILCRKQTHQVILPIIDLFLFISLIGVCNSCFDLYHLFYTGMGAIFSFKLLTILGAL